MAEVPRVELTWGQDGKPRYRASGVSEDTGKLLVWGIGRLDATGPRLYGSLIPIGEQADLRWIRYRSKLPLEMGADGRYRPGTYEVEVGQPAPGSSKQSLGSASGTAAASVPKTSGSSAGVGLALLALGLAVGIGVRAGSWWLFRSYPNLMAGEDGETFAGILSLVAFGALGLGGGAAAQRWDRLKFPAIVLVVLIIPLLFFLPDYFGYHDAVARLAESRHVDLRAAQALVEAFLDRELGFGGPVALFLHNARERFADTVGPTWSMVMDCGQQLFFLGCGYFAAGMAAKYGPVALIPDIG